MTLTINSLTQVSNALGMVAVATSVVAIPLMFRHKSKLAKEAKQEAKRKADRKKRQEEISDEISEKQLEEQRLKVEILTLTRDQKQKELSDKDKGNK